MFVAPDNGFEVSLAAAMEKKDVPVQIVANEAEAEYILRPLPLAMHKESEAGKIARCAFAYCLGIADSGEVSVQLIRKDTERIVWAYQVNKQRGVKTRQAMAEAIAKHMRKEVFESSRPSNPMAFR